ncbi:hypothetical protein [Halobacteriovorax sp. RT-1-4]|uniref:hypothetical protein n=1 Tax=unclassified Halobacteriovorax TaxID=2639665 RepID=UPI00399A49BF
MMMDNRNWLIRTKSNKILGPLSKQKVIEFVQDGTLTEEDEICSGNGYWFWIKEDDLLNRYLFGEEEQSFNPVSEAKTKVASSVSKLVKTTGIVEKIKDSEELPATPSSTEAETTASGSISINTTEDGEEIVLPEDGDLDFPEPIDYSNNTLPQHDAPVVTNASPLKDMDAGVSMAEVAEAMNVEEEEIVLPSDDDLDFPDLGSTQSTLSLVSEEQTDTSSSESQIDLLVAEAEAEKEIIVAEADSNLDEIAEDARLALEEEKLAGLPASAPNLDEEEEIKPMKAVEMPRPKRKKTKKKTTKSKKKKRKSDYSFVYVAIGVLIILLFFISKFYSKLVGKDLFSELHFKMPTTTVLAQEFQADKKKRYF